MARLQEEKEEPSVPKGNSTLQPGGRRRLRLFSSYRSAQGYSPSPSVRHVASRLQPQVTAAVRSVPHPTSSQIYAKSGAGADEIPSYEDDLRHSMPNLAKTSLRSLEAEKQSQFGVGSPGPEQTH
ncbi:unnamed protein product [Ranitomeya imitator]|uniref:Uncharacterized protein n=1 Tax=Ranitomeya imitator TaxID=111125 RepID=A0ABN9LSU6_9NEOB|nr:unnamed protein product [Ranitomeya imitator]